MPLILTEEQEMLKESARGFLDEKAPVAALRAALRLWLGARVAKGEPQ